jgi:DNA polymerase
MFVGEQPGDQEDLAGKPFVGPAGRLLDRALEEAGIDRQQVYVTNAVKHFKWEPSGKKRLHKKPSAREIAACRPWLEAEMESLKPRIIVCLGSTALLSILGREAAVMQDRGKFFAGPEGRKVFVTVHPSMLLRIPDESRRRREFAKFVHELKRMQRGI